MGRANNRLGDQSAPTIVAAYDTFLFYGIFIGRGIYDPVAATLAKAERLIP